MYIHRIGYFHLFMFCWGHLTQTHITFSSLLIARYVVVVVVVVGCGCCIHFKIFFEVFFVFFFVFFFFVVE